MKSVYTCLWFDNNAHEAVALYQRVLGAKVTVETPIPTSKSAPGETSHPLVVPFSIDGQRFVGLNGGPQFPFTECVSIQIHCDDQQEVDRYWQGLLDGGGEESQCGWLKDRFGLSWQIVPARLIELMSANDPALLERVTQAYTPMRKLDLARSKQLPPAPRRYRVADDLAPRSARRTRDEPPWPVTRSPARPAAVARSQADRVETRANSLCPMANWLRRALRAAQPPLAVDVDAIRCRRWPTDA